MIAVGDITGFWTLDVEPSEPVHNHAVVLALELAVNPTVPPLHIGLPFVGAAVGVGLMVTVVVYIFDGLQPDAPAILLTVSE